MPDDTWNERKKAMEDAYFERQNKEALERIKARELSRNRPSPITGEPMEQIAIMGVVVDRCPTSGGIWLDAGELEEIINQSKQSAEQGGTSLVDFFSSLFSAKSRTEFVLSDQMA